MKTNVATERDGRLLEIQNRVLWLAMKMIYHANHERVNADGSKVGGHQASSSSVVTILTALMFDFMRAGDRLSVKPHASPVYHAIQYLIGNLPSEYLTQLRMFHGLQAYPSRTKDPDPVDFSTGSVGLGAVAPNFAAVVNRYNRTHFGECDGEDRRYISVVGDAELDEGSVWEAIAEPKISHVSQTLWVVDLNRQSLDRVIPGIRVRVWREMFAANGWTVVDAKYGKRLQAAFEEPNGDLLRGAIDEMSNTAYQRLLRLPPEQLREWLPRSSRYPRDLERFIGHWDDPTLLDLFRNLGGHDFPTLREAFERVDQSDSPGVVFAYTLKGWMLPSEGDPLNHSVTLTEDQMVQLQRELGISDDRIWSAFEPESPAGQLCSQAKTRFAIPEKKDLGPSSKFPHDLGREYTGQMSSQQIFGMVLTALSRQSGDLVDRIVTVSPDVASSTNLGGWINKMGVWTEEDLESLPDELVRPLIWSESPKGQHLELGISENNLFMMLGQLGLSYEMHGEMLFPIGTLYDPFVRRGLDAFVYSIYSGARFMVVGTPSGITLAPEGGAHQSMLTPSIGIEFPDLTFYEPCFGKDVEWVMLAGLEDIRQRKRSVYLRLTSKRVDQSLLTLPEDKESLEKMRLQVLDGAYKIIDRNTEAEYEPGRNVVNLVACGAMVPEAVEASTRLKKDGIYVNVINVTGPGPLYASFQRSVRKSVEGSGPSEFMIEVVPLSERKAPVVTVVDGHPHSLAWIGGALNARTLPLGVVGFGQSGSRVDLYREYGIDVKGIEAACRKAVEP